MSTPENTSRQRHDIDSGKTGDKVDFPDPAAAPLGTDAEAGGEPEPAAVQPKRITPRPGSGMRREQLGVLVYSLAAAAVSVAILGLTLWTA